jgi:hypothetical protein
MRVATILAGTLAAASISHAQAPQLGADRAAGIAFRSGTQRVTMAVECVVRRGRLDILAVDSTPPVLRNGLNLDPLGSRGDYYLFDSASFILVRPASKTFSVFALKATSHNFNNGREGWPEIFDFPTIRTQSVSAAEGAKRRLERHGAFDIFWHVDVDWDLPTFNVLSRGHIDVIDAPFSESTVARWFGPALALAQLATIDSARFPSERIGLTSVAPLIGDNGATTNFASKQRLTQLRITAIELPRLTLPADYNPVVVAGSLTERQAEDQAAHWRASPRIR